MNTSSPTLYKCKIVFIVDTTASMKRSIDAVRAFISNVLVKAKAIFPGIQVQLAFVGYRDVEEAEKFQKIYLLQSRTKNSSNFLQDAKHLVVGIQPRMYLADSMKR
jgi:hypothetical protein